MLPACAFLSGWILPECAHASRLAYGSAYVLGSSEFPGALLAQRALEPVPVEPAQLGPRSEPPTPLKPGTAFLLSAALPGASQIRERKLRGYMMLGVEAGFVFAYQALHTGGRDRLGAAEAMARSAYSIDAYQANALAAPGANPAQVEANVNRLRDLLLNNTAEFYDAIARESELAYGWSGSGQQQVYARRREDGNRLLTHANTLLSGVLLNHLVSAFDAFASARRYQRELGGGVKFKSDLDPFRGRGSVRLVKSLW